MRFTRRDFLNRTAGLTAALPLWARESRTGSVSAQKVIERRIYSAESVLPPRRLLVRHGIRAVAIRKEPGSVEYVIRFDSLEARTRAWNAFNSDAEWSALREARSVRLMEIRFC